ncbi:unnamed protein product [Caenorhabditis brenneri]
MFLKSVTIDNFKHFGYMKVDNFDCLTAFQGVNGCGKSGIMQAVALAFGYNEDNLENMLKDGTRVAVELSVDGQKTSKSFERRFSKGLCKFFINNRSVEYEKYYEEMAKLGIMKDTEIVPVFTDECNTLNKKRLGHFLGDLSDKNGYGKQLDELLEKRDSAAAEIKKFEDQKVSIESERVNTQEFYLVSLYLLSLQIDTAKTKIDECKASEAQSKACGKFKVDKVKVKRTRKAKVAQEDPESLESLTKNHQLLLAKRHYFLRQAQINRIEVPLLYGTMDVLTKTELRCINGKNKSKKAIDVKHTFSMDEIEKGSKVQINYDFIKEKYALIPNLERLEGHCQFAKRTVDASVSQQKLDAETSKLQLIIRENLRETGSTAAQWKRYEANRKMVEIKALRLKAFSSFFEKVSQNIDGIYKDLCADVTREANLAIPPAPHGTKKDNRPWKRISFSVKKDGVNVDYLELSGGEQTMLEVALKFAIAEAIQAPILLLDSIDTGVHISNSKRLVPFLVRQSKRRQVVVTGSSSDFYKVLREENIRVNTIQK